MSSIADRRSRIARVRRVQHLQAAGAVSAAEGKLTQLEDSAARIVSLRDSLVPGQGMTSGAALGSIGELTARLENARTSLTRAIDQAQDVVDLKIDERRDAHIARESAERLQVRAVAEMQREIEQRMMSAIRPRNGGGSRG